MALYNLSLNVPAIICSGEVAFKGAFVGIEHKAAFNLALVVRPLRMDTKPVLFESLDVWRVGKFIIVVICPKAFVCSRKADLKRGIELISCFGQYVLPAKAVVIERRVRIVVESR